MKGRRVAAAVGIKTTDLPPGPGRPYAVNGADLCPPGCATPMTLDGPPDSAAPCPVYFREWGRVLGGEIRSLIGAGTLPGLRHTPDALPLGEGPWPGYGGAQLKPAEVCLVCAKSGYRFSPRRGTRLRTVEALRLGEARAGSATR